MAEWIYGMVAVSIFGMVVMQMTPEGTYQRYVRLCLGGVFVLVAGAPVLTLLSSLGKNDVSLAQQVVASWWNDQVWSSEEPMAGGNYDDELHAWEKTMEQQLQNKQERWMAESLAILAEDYGFVCLNYQVQWQGDWPGQLTLWVADRESEPSECDMVPVSTVESVELTQVMLGDPVQEGREREGLSREMTYEPSELRPLRLAIQQVWQLEEEQVRIYWERDPS